MPTPPLPAAARRDSSVVTGSSSAGLNVDLVRAVRWWEHDRFDEDGFHRGAELVAFAVLNPATRDRRRPPDAAWEHYGQRSFRKEMTELFSGPAAGRLVRQGPPEVARELRTCVDASRIWSVSSPDPPRRSMDAAWGAASLGPSGR